MSVRSAICRGTRIPLGLSAQDRRQCVRVCASEREREGERFVFRHLILPDIGTPHPLVTGCHECSDGGGETQWPAQAGLAAEGRPPLAPGFQLSFLHCFVILLLIIPGHFVLVYIRVRFLLRTCSQVIHLSRSSWEPESGRQVTALAGTRNGG